MQYRLLKVFRINLSITTIANRNILLEIVSQMRGNIYVPTEATDRLIRAEKEQWEGNG